VSTFYYFRSTCYTLHHITSHNSFLRNYELTPVETANLLVYVHDSAGRRSLKARFTHYITSHLTRFSYATIKTAVETANLLVYVHDSDAPAFTELAQPIQPGVFSTLSMNKNVYSNLPHPHGDCKKREKGYSDEKCRQKCHLQSMLERCGCVVHLNTTPFPEFDDSPTCGWFTVSLFSRCCCAFSCALFFAHAFVVV
jgi:hypothetical protein